MLMRICCIKIVKFTQKTFSCTIFTQMYTVFFARCLTAKHKGGLQAGSVMSLYALSSHTSQRLNDELQHHTQDLT